MKIISDMLKVGEQRHYFRKRWKSAEKALKNFQDSGDTEQLHELRVEIKKLRALLMLDKKQFSGKDSRRHFKNVKKIFKKAAKARSVQVNMELMEEYGLMDPETEKQQTTKLIHEAKKFHSDCGKYIKYFRKEPAYFLNGFSKISKNELGKIVEKQIGEIEICFFENMQTRKLHDCRKKLKILYYQSAMFSEKMLKEMQLNRNYVRKLEKAIGEWHDTDLVLAIAKRKNTEKKILYRVENITKRKLSAINSLATGFKKKISRVN
jgi:CHAD domain-containing protein